MHLSFVSDTESDSVMSLLSLSIDSIRHKSIRNKEPQWTQKTHEFGITLKQENS